MITLSHEPPRRPYRIHHSRTWRVTGAVLLAHIAVAWLLTLGMLSQQPTTGEADNIIMASVIMDTPAPPAPKPQPAQPKVKSQPQPKPTPVVQPQLQPSPVVTPAAPSEAAPVLPAAMPSPTPAAAAAAPVAGNPRPNTTPSPAVVLPSTDADYLNNPKPLYPTASKRMGEEGTVVIRVFINTEGRAEKAEIRTSSGYTRLDNVALDTVKRWRFVPGKRAGVPEAMWFNVPIRFVLD